MMFKIDDFQKDYSNVIGALAEVAINPTAISIDVNKIPAKDGNLKDIVSIIKNANNIMI